MTPSTLTTAAAATSGPSAGSMDFAMIKRLVLKDWYFLRGPILGYLAAGALALALVSQAGEGTFFAGSILLITVLITIGIHLAMATVVEERKNQTLAFVMSLPVSPAEYTTAKIFANLLIFLLPWLALLVGSFAVIAGNAALPDGLIPFTGIVLLEIFASSFLILAVALISESQSWTIGAIVFGNLFFQGFLYYVSHIPSIGQTMNGPRIVWSPAAVNLLVGEIVSIALMVGLTFWLQSRKTDFL
ncbi:MAG TPA: ABC transporter permease [Thermoanaerobaculia bacterium]|nr:ABC transporter permease [Thermoanaerobaculia bacterium]